MRSLAVLLCLSSPAAAWEFSASPVCTLSHAEGGASVSVTHDPSRPQPYAIAIVLARSWDPAPVFAMRFDGGRGLIITTDRHALSDGNRRLTVSDRGFGNVLDGLEFNTSATALLGDAAVPFSLDGVAPEMRAFRACTEAPTA